jgi:hypothetical protein
MLGTGSGIMTSNSTRAPATSVAPLAGVITVIGGGSARAVGGVTPNTPRANMHAANCFFGTSLLSARFSPLTSDCTPFHKAG